MYFAVTINVSFNNVLVSFFLRNSLILESIIRGYKLFMDPYNAENNTIVTWSKPDKKAPSPEMIQVI